MNIDIAARHMDLSNGIREYILDRGSRMNRYFEGVVRCEFVLDQEAGKHSVEIKVHAPRNDLTAKFAHEDVHAAVDGALDKIEQQMRRLKDKFKDHHRGDRGAAARKGAEEPGEETYQDVLEREL